MVEEDAEGPRIDAAKKATRELVDFLPDTAQMGLIAYGAQESNAPDNREKAARTSSASCQLARWTTKSSARLSTG